MNDLKIFTKKGNIPYIERVSIDKINGWPNIRKKISNINEKTKTFISMFNIIESIKANFSFFKKLRSSLINDIVSKRFPSYLKNLNIVG